MWHDSIPTGRDSAKPSQKACCAPPSHRSGRSGNSVSESKTGEQKKGKSERACFPATEFKTPGAPKALHHVAHESEDRDAIVSEELATDADEHEAPRHLQGIFQPAREAESKEQPADVGRETWRQ